MTGRHEVADRREAADRHVANGRIRFCPACAAPLPGPPPVECTGCGYALFVNPRPTGTPIIISEAEFLIVRRAREPCRGQWELPGGFCDGWESPADAAMREAREELGLEIALTGFVGMYIGNYEFQDQILPVLDCFWRATIVSGQIRLDPAELLEYRWAPLADPPAMAFATMDTALAALTAKTAPGGKSRAAFDPSTAGA